MLVFQPIDHVSVSAPTDGIGPTQGQREQVEGNEDGNEYVDTRKGYDALATYGLSCAEL